MANFNLNAVLRGAQLTLVGAHRALQNPALFTSDHYRQALLAVAAGIVIRLIVFIPVIGVRVLLWFLGLFIDTQSASWDENVIEGLSFIEHSVLQVPFFLMSLMRYITPTLDRTFMESLDWVDRTYIAKHRSENPGQLRAMYYPNLSQYPAHGSSRTSPSPETKKSPMDFVIRSARKAGISLAIYALSFLPYVGRFVLPAASFYTFRQAVGLQPALVIFGTGIFLPKKYVVRFLQSYFSSRSMMRELLEPYFSRIHYTPEQKRRWFKDREAVLFGFGVGFFTLIKVPLFGVLIYGIAEASTAYLITKITDPPPPPSEAGEWIQTHVRWKNEHEFINISLADFDKLNVQLEEKLHSQRQEELPGKKFS